MRTVHFLWLCLWLAGWNITQAQDGLPHLTGTIKNYAKKEVAITVHSFWKWIEDSHYEKVITDERGNFSFAVPFEGFPVRYVSLAVDIEGVFDELLLEPNDKIHLTFDLQKFPQTLQITGNAAWKVEHYRQDWAYFQKYYHWTPDKPILPIQQHYALADSLNKLRLQAFEKVKKQASPIFQQLRQADLAGHLSGTYPSLLDVRMMKLEEKEEEKIGNYYDSLALQNTLSLTPPQDKNLIFSDSYSIYVSNLVWKLANQARRKIGYPAEEKKWYFSAYYQFKSLLLPVLAEKILGENIRQSMGDEHGFANDTLLLQDYMRSYPTSKYLPKVRTIYNALLRYQVGKPAYDFALEDLAGEKIKLSDLKGKLVMIDFWGTWCGGCKKEQPYLKEVCKELEGTDFQMILVCVNDDKTDWKNYIETKNITSPNILHLWADDAETKILQECYNFLSVPHKVMVDKQGILIDWKYNHFGKENATEIQQAIEKLLSK
jgi:peroxiredoxin